MKDNVNDFRAVETLFHRVSSLGQSGYLIFLLTFHFSLTFSLLDHLHLPKRSHVTTVWYY